MSLGSMPKDPDAVLPYSINWATEGSYVNDGTAADTGWLQGDTIVTSSWSFTGPDTALAIDSDSNNTVVATVVLSGGTHRRSYTVTNHVVLASGYEDDRSICVEVYQR